MPDVTEQVVVDLVCHLFDPHLVRSRTGIKSLVSPAIALDFSFLPTSPPPIPLDSKRHSIAAQRLALFRIPALVVNHLPGFSWTLEHVRGVQNVVNEAGRSVWVVDVEWTLSGGIYPLTKLPFVGPKLHLEHVSKRQIELVFEPPATSEEAGRDSPPSVDQKGLSSTPPTIFTPDETKHSPEIELVLTRVSYSGIKVPERFKALPGYSLLAFLVPYLIDLLLAPFYGLLLLLGLDHSSSSLSSRSSTRRRNQKSLDRKGKGKDHIIPPASRHPKTKAHLASYERGASSSDSEDGVESIFDPNAKESRYHRVMRIGQNVLYDVRRTLESLASGTRETREEFRDLVFTIRRMVMVAVEIVLGVVRAGLDVLGAGVGSAIEEGERIARETRKEEEEMRQTRAQTRYGRSSGPPGNNKSSMAKSPTLAKRVSFSVPEDEESPSFFVTSIDSSPPSRTPGLAAFFTTESPFVEEDEGEDSQTSGLRERNIFTSRPLRTAQGLYDLAPEDDDASLSRPRHQGHHLASSSDSFLHPSETTSSTERRFHRRREDTPIPGHLYGAPFDEELETGTTSRCGQLSPHAASFPHPMVAQDTTFVVVSSLETFEDVEAEEAVEEEGEPAGVQVSSSYGARVHGESRREPFRTDSSPIDITTSRTPFAPDVVSLAIVSPPLVTVPAFPSSSTNMGRSSSQHSISPAFGFSPPQSGQLYSKGSTSGSSSLSPITPGASPVVQRSAGPVSSPMVHESSGSGSSQAWSRFGQPMEEVVRKEEVRAPAEGEGEGAEEEGEKAAVRTKGRKRKGKKRGSSSKA